MLIKVNRKELTKHISIVQKAISQRTTRQILEGIKISAKDNILILTATDTEISIKTELKAIVEREGEIVINSRLFGDIIRKLENDIININVENYMMNLKCGDSIFNLSTQKADEYPDLPKVEEDITIDMSAHKVSKSRN